MGKWKKLKKAKKKNIGSIKNSFPFKFSDRELQKVVVRIKITFFFFLFRCDEEKLNIQIHNT
jgi:hypothetical protein